MLNVTTSRPRCTEIEALYTLVNEENKSATLNIRIVKYWDPPPNQPPNANPVAATPSAAPDAAAALHTTTAASSSEASPAASVVAR